MKQFIYYYVINSENVLFLKQITADIVLFMPADDNFEAFDISASFTLRGVILSILQGNNDRKPFPQFPCDNKAIDYISNRLLQLFGYVVTSADFKVF